MLSIKKIILSLLIFLSLGAAFAQAPSFDKNFANYLTDKTPDQYGRVETVFNICIDRNISLIQNIKNLFYPNQLIAAISPVCAAQSTGGQLWDVIRVLGFAILFVFLIVVGVNFIMNANEADGAKKAGMSLIYIGYGAFLLFGATWILGSVLNIETIQGTSQIVERVQNTLFLQILSFFKVLAFIAAVLMIVVYGFRIMAAMDQSDKIKAAQKGLVNIILALVFIKIIDYVFYIAQTPEFGAKASALIIDVARVAGYIIGAAFVLAIFYAGFLMLTSAGKEETFKKAKGLIVNIFIGSVVVFLFLLIIYQIFNEFVLK